MATNILENLQVILIAEFLFTHIYTFVSESVMKICLSNDYEYVALAGWPYNLISLCLYCILT